MLTSSNPTDTATCPGYWRKQATMPSRLRGWTRGRVGFGSVIQSTGRLRRFTAREFCSKASVCHQKLYPRHARRYTAAMNAPKYAVRRATVDDLGGLKQLWQRARLQVLDLEKRLTDFQLLSSDNADLIGAI